MTYRTNAEPEQPREPQEWPPNATRALCLAGIVACGFVGDHFQSVGVSLSMITVGFLLVGWLISTVLVGES